MCISCMKGGVFFQSFCKYFSRDMSCPIPCRPSRMPSQRAHLSLSEVPGHREWGPSAVHREVALASSSTGGRGPRSAAPPTGWYGLLPKFDCSSVPIFLGVQGWDLATDSLKEFFNIDSIFCTCFNNDGTYGFSVFLRILQGNLPNIWEITFVSSNSHDNVFWTMFFQFFHPFLQGMEWVLFGNIIHYDSCSGSTIVHGSQGMEPFLTSSIPDEEFVKFISTRHSFGHKRRPNGRADVVIKVILDKSTHNARFPNPGVPEKAHFELPYRHHVLGTGPGRGSASSGAPAAPRPRRASVLQSPPFPRGAAGGTAAAAISGPAAAGHVAPPAPPGASAWLLGTPGSQERPQAASAAPGPAAVLGVPPPSDPLSG